MAAPRREEEEYTFDKFDDGSNSKYIFHISHAEKNQYCNHVKIFLIPVRIF